MIEQAEGANLRRPAEQQPQAAAPPITTDAEPIRPTPDDALHGMPPDLTGHAPPGEHRAAEQPLHWGVIIALCVVVGLFVLALGTLISAGG